MINRKICSENKLEIRDLKRKAKRILKWNESYPGQLTQTRRLNLTVKLNDIMERVEYLQRDKYANLRENKDENYEFNYVLKKSRVKNRKA